MVVASPSKTSELHSDTVDVQQDIDEPIRRRLLTVDEYYKAAKKGVFRPDERLELIDGEVIEKLSPQLTPHAVCVMLVSQAFVIAFGETHCVRSQLPLALDRYNEPEPDLIVARGKTRDYLAHHPSADDIVLLIEISDSTRRLDLGRKRSLYARFQIPEYWVIDLKTRCILAHLNPSDDPDAGSSLKYKSITTYLEADVIVPRFAPERSFAVSDHLP